MGQQQYKVVFQPQGRAVSVLPGTKIIEAAAVAGIIIDTPCGGKGTCKKCKIKIVQPKDKAGECLACQTAVFADTVIEVPRNSLLTRLDKIAISSDMPAIEFDDKYPCDKEKCFGVAVDVGTTTLAASLVCLSKRIEIAVTSAMNPQIACGDDVVSRINHASSPVGLSELQTLIISRTNELVGTLCRQAEIDRQDIYELTIAGNTTMEHLFCGIDLSRSVIC
ncbi:MAG: 2Fe-2S iron-sulfur cluster-binding protein, partial [Phycisphaerae bacterium]